MQPSESKRLYERRVEFLTGDDKDKFGSYTLVGTLNADRDVGVPIVVMMHGLTSNRSSSKLVSLQYELEYLGIGSFRFDCWGAGESEGDPKEVNLENIEKIRKIRLNDLGCAVGYIADIHGDDKIGIVGSSFGANVAAIYASEDKVDALVLRAPVLKSIQKYLKLITAPTLLVTGSEDKLSTVDDMITARSELGSKYRDLKIIAGADHGCDNYIHEAEFARSAANWFDKCLLPV